jgi:hypothetical protein
MGKIHRHVQQIDWLNIVCNQVLEQLSLQNYNDITKMKFLNKF